MPARLAIDLNAAGPASLRGWGPGWPTDRRRDMAKITSGGLQLWAHHGVAPLVAWLIDETERRGYDLKDGQSWGYANRAVRGTKTPSNHSWGLAIDGNAPANPMASKLITDMPAWMPDLWNEWGFRWGGDYRGRKDAMHYEFMGTPDDAACLIGQLGLARLPSRQQPTVIVPGGSMIEIARKPVVLLVDPGGAGYWQVSEEGGVFTFGDLPFHGSLGDKQLNSPIVGGDVTPDGKGYWFVAADGGVFAFGTAGFFGSMGGVKLNRPIVDLDRSPSGKGYALMASDGGLFCFGDFTYRGSVVFKG